MNNAEVVELIGKHFVPVALNADRLPKSEAGNFFKKLKRRWPQGLWVVTPEGETIAFHYHQNVPGASYSKNAQLWIDGTIAMLKEAIEELRLQPDRKVRGLNPFPDRGSGFGEKQTMRLTVNVIGLRRGQQDGPPVVDSILFSKENWQPFAPVDGRCAIPEDVAKQFAPALSPMTDSILAPIPSDLSQASIIGRVTRSSGNLQVIRYSATFASKHYRDGDRSYPIMTESKGEGVGVYDGTSRQFQSMTWVLKGTFTMGSKGSLIDTASVVEWKQK